ncbi:MAG TPA: OmpA family protein [Pyrinomonadaceae bacterium]|nr:OmpA family protein [Pyrinomonadaceae bacterium]
MFRNTRLARAFVFATLLAFAASPALAQNSTTSSQSTAVSGQKLKVKGIVTRRDADTFTVQNDTGGTTTVALTDATSVKTKGGFFGGGTRYGATQILRGLRVEVEGRTDSSGQLVAEKVRFGDKDLRVAQSIEARVDPVETRVGTAENKIDTVEQNAQRMSGQLDELAAVSNAARGGAVAAMETAESAIQGVNATNERISALDDFTPQQSLNINFKHRSAVLTPEAKLQLDELAKVANATKGYMIEVSGYAFDWRNKNSNRRLSQQRADAVVRYLAENQRIPLRRIVNPFGYGSTAEPIADNTTREGRAENRRAEVRLLVNRGLTGSAPEMNESKISSATP